MKITTFQKLDSLRLFICYTCIRYTILIKSVEKPFVAIFLGVKPYYALNLYDTVYLVLTDISVVVVFYTRGTWIPGSVISSQEVDLL